MELSRSAGNVIILTGKSEAGSLGRWLWEKWEGKQKGDGVWGGGAVGNLVELEETVQVEVRYLSSFSVYFQILPTSDPLPS